MAEIIKEVFKEGNTISFTQMNDVHNDLSTSNVESVNLSSGWVSYEHIDATSPITSIYSYSNPTKTDVTYTNTTYAVVSQGGNDCEITDIINMEQGEILRVSGNALVAEVSPNDAQNHYYAFRLVITYTDAGGGTIVSPSFGYSTHALTRNPTESTTFSSDEVNFQTVQFSHIYHNTVSGRVINNIKLEVCLQPNTGANSIDIRRHSIQAIQERR